MSPDDPSPHEVPFDDEFAQDTVAAPPAAPPVRPTTSTAQWRKFSLSNIGIFIDRWGDVIEGRAELADSIRADVYQTLRDKHMPDVRVEPVKANVGFLSENRPYIITTTSPGVTTAIYIARHGKDLYVSWRTHVRGVINWRLLAVLAAMALLPTLCISPCLFVANLATSITNPFGNGPNLGSIGSAIAPLIGIGFGFFLTELLLVALAGYFFRGNFLIFFFVEPTIFDAEDVAAMSLSAHKAIQNAVEKAGVHASLLAKTTFRAGRKSEQL